MKKIKIGVLISGSGSNLQAIIDATEKGSLLGEVIFVGSDTPNVKGLERAEKHNIESFVVNYKEIITDYKKSEGKSEIPQDFNLSELLKKQKLFDSDKLDKAKFFLESRAIAEEKILKNIEKFEKFDVLALAGFMRIFSPYFIDKINKDKMRIVNIHPALLPSFPGTNGYEDTFNYGCKVGGCTVHFVDYGEDTGPIIGQKCFTINPDDTIETVKAKGLKLEWQLYPECLKLFCEGKENVFKRT